MIRPTLTIVIILITFSSTQCLPQTAARFDVLITEIFADPTPSVQLPAFEFIELMNISKRTINLKDWRIGDGSSTATISSTVILAPDSFVILCSNTAASLFDAYGNSVGISGFPSLDNETDVLILRSPENVTIHAVNYSRRWYENGVRSEGGWSLEMIDVQNPCAGSLNWKGSQSAAGGTPGKRNSVSGLNKDDDPPRPVRSYSTDSMTMVVVFDEPVDSLAAAHGSNYSLNDRSIHPIHARPVAPLFTEVRLTFATMLSHRMLYQLTVSKVTDCVGNEIGSGAVVRTGISSPADANDVVINEILFNPKADGSDFIELYNKSDKIIDLQTLHAANRNSTGVLTNIRNLSPGSWLFFPGDFIVITENASWLRQSYHIPNESIILEIPSLPSLPDDAGTLVITTASNTLVDEVRYDAKWHFALIDDDEGVSIERVDYSEASQSKDNWASAASTVGHATPGYKNSQWTADSQLQGSFELGLKVFSPDNDGVDDYATITYELTQPGFVANITIFDSHGRPVRHLAKNATLAKDGYFRWDGLDDASQRLPLGIYIVFTEIFNLKGKTKRFKSAVTLARRF